MMKRLLFFLFVVFTALGGGAQTATLEANQIRAYFEAGKPFFTNQGGAGFEVPKGSGQHSIYSMGLRMGGTDVGGQLKLSDLMKNEFMPGPYGEWDSSRFNRVWVINKSDILLHQSNFNQTGYVMPEAIASWPAHGDPSKNQAMDLAPFKDVNSNGKYDPKNGDYPDVPGDQAIYFILNDDFLRVNSTVPTGFEVHVTAFAFNCGLSEDLAHTTFLRYKIINRSLFTLRDFYAGTYFDLDIGYPLDDFFATDVSRSSVIGYNGFSVDGTGGADHYGPAPPAQALVILRGLTAEKDNTDNAAGIGVGESTNGIGYGDGKIDNEIWGLTASFGTSGSSIDGTATERYKMMTDNWWNDGTPQYYGGSGHYSDSTTDTSTLARFMFPGSSDAAGYGTGKPGLPEWSEESAGNVPFDRAVLAITGPAIFAPGGSEVIDLALVYARDTSSAWPSGSLNAVKARIDNIRNMYLNNSGPCNAAFSLLSKPTLNNPVLEVYPNPTSNYINIKGNFDSYKLFDIYGKLVRQGNEKQIDISAEPSAVYFLHVNAGPESRTFRVVNTK